MVGNLSTPNGSVAEMQASVLSQLTYGENLNDLSKANVGQFILNASQYPVLREYTNFTEIRLFCRKPALHSRTVDVAITVDEQIYDYLLNKDFSGSYCDKTYRFLSGDNSLLSGVACNKLLFTGYGYSITGAIIYKIYNYHVIFEVSHGRFECDDHHENKSIGGVWKYYVR